MEQNNQPNKNNADIKLDGGGEPIDFNPKKNLSQKTVALVLVFVILIIAGSFYYFYKVNIMLPINDNGPKENIETIKDKEAEVDKNLDTDQDKLPDYLEKILGTKINNPDTDGDGYDDFDEIKNGYSPLTSEKYSAEEWDNVKEKIKGEDEGLFGEMFGGVVSNSDFTCGTDIVADIDNNIYNTVLIGTQCWLKQNLRTGTQLATGNTTPSNNGTIEKWCPAPSGTAGTVDNIQYAANCVTDGGLYQWNEAMGYVTTEGAQGICPTGWHIPTDAQQYILENYLKDGANTCVSTRTGWDCDTAGTKLKVGGTSGFEGILAGLRSTDGSFYNRLTNAYLWYSSQYDASFAWERILSSGSSTVYRYLSNKAYGFSVRCLKD
ncbi:hypothetical protein KKB43_01530 [Patescibacteria group bacterium]|nr:hypothetical protein [Patescibacteria group bacterium]MBU4579676.1 hypothetical protein [Patescibacteria group bacterium]